jgi:hypothetical protein
VQLPCHVMSIKWLRDYLCLHLLACVQGSFNASTWFAWLDGTCTDKINQIYKQNSGLQHVLHGNCCRVLTRKKFLKLDSFCIVDKLKLVGQRVFVTSINRMLLSSLHTKSAMSISACYAELKLDSIINFLHPTIAQMS